MKPWLLFNRSLCSRIACEIGNILLISPSKMVLTDKQRTELDAAVFAYLMAAGYKATAELLSDEHRLVHHDNIDEVPASSDALERRWTSVSKLQRDIGELNETIRTLEQELADRPRLRPKKSIEYVPLKQPKRVMKGHRSAITFLSLHPTISTVASSSSDGMIKLWDWESGVCEATLRGHTDVVNCVVFEQEGALLATCSSDHTVRIWLYDAKKPSSSSCIRTLVGHDDTVSCACFVSSESLITCSRDGTVRQWDITTGFCNRRISAHKEWVKACALSSGRDKIITAAIDKRVYVWNFKDSQPICELVGHEHVVETVASCPTYKVYGYLSKNSNVLEAYRSGYDVYVKQMDKVAACSSAAPVGALCGDIMATGGRDRCIRIYDLRSLSNTVPVLTLSGHDGWVKSLVWHPSGRYLLSCGDDGSMRVWDMTNSNHIDYHISENPLTSVVIHHVMPIVCVGGDDGGVRMFECE